MVGSSSVGAFDAHAGLGALEEEDQEDAGGEERRPP